MTTLQELVDEAVELGMSRKEAENRAMESFWDSFFKQFAQDLSAKEERDYVKYLVLRTRANGNITK